MNGPRDPLDAALEALPRDAQPTRDLWTGIHAEISGQPSVHAGSSGGTSPPGLPFGRVGHRWSSPATATWMRLAAGFVLIVASSLTTYVITRQAAQENVLQAQRAVEIHQPVVPVMPANFGGQQELNAEYLSARASLDAEFQRQLAMLPPVTRAKLERNLADLRRAASEISATLAEHPSHPLLQELLLSTYQSELALLGSVTNMNVPTKTTSPHETRL
ncbi:hypothetical protein [Povalibacter sp.]|uniref:hypothetical protein n=1 Tax=Povalibacter sp. TaxID=1962978 RepID=UPI002F4235ED